MQKVQDKKIVESIVDALLTDGEVKVQGLGFLSIKKCKGGGKRIFRGEEVVTPSYNKITFRPYGPLKRAIQKYGG